MGRQPTRGPVPGTGYITDIVLWDRVITDAERDEMLAWAKHRIKE